MKILKKIGLICCAVLLAVGSFLIPKHFSTQSLMLAKADTTVSQGYTYIGSELFYLDMIVLNNGNNEPESRVVVFDLTLESVPAQNYAIKLSTHSKIYDSFYRFETPDNLVFATWDNPVGTTPFITPSSSDNVDVTSRNKLVYGTNFNTWIPVYYKTTGQFNCNVISVNLSTVPVSQSIYSDWTYFLNSNYKIIQLVYTDVNSNTFTMQFFTLASVSLTSRTYYLSNALNLDESQQYNAGYQQGLIANQDNIYQSGRQDGFNGGYNQGYQEGAAAASSYTFFSLIGAAVDVPITALTSLLNFTFLGVNLLAFVTSILTLALIIFVIKKFMGKG